MRKKEQIKLLRDTVSTLQRNMQFHELQVESLEKSIAKLQSILVESGIVEYDWEPNAPKGSSITSNNRYGVTTYTKINKVF